MTTSIENRDQLERRPRNRSEARARRRAFSAARRHEQMFTPNFCTDYIDAAHHVAQPMKVALILHSTIQLRRARRLYHGGSYILGLEGMMPILSCVTILTAGRYSGRKYHHQFCMNGILVRSGELLYELDTLDICLRWKLQC